MYRKPILIGRGQGGALVYAALASGPDGSYRAVISDGFSPMLPGAKPWCKSGSLVAKAIVHPFHGWHFTHSRPLPSPWIILHARQDKGLSLTALHSFAHRSGNATAQVIETTPATRETRLLAQIEPLIVPPAVARTEDHGLPPLPTDLPLTIVADPAAPRTDMMAVLYSGDGGWVGLDKDVAAQLAHAGIPVVGMDSLSYFWSQRTPEGGAQDLDAIIRGYSSRWQRPHILIVGYSFGADALPYIIAHLPPQSRETIQSLSLLGLSSSADFQFHLSSWLNMESTTPYPTIPAIEKLRGLPMLCIKGEDEGDSACPSIPAGLAHVVVVPGGHHFDRNAPLVARTIIASQPRRGIL